MPIVVVSARRVCHTVTTNGLTRNGSQPTPVGAILVFGEYG